MMKCTSLGILLAAVLYAPAAKAQPSGNQCPGGAGSCNCQLNSVESLRALIRNEVAAEVEAEVASRLAATPALGLLYLVRTGDNLVALKNISGVTVRGTGSNRAELPNFNSSTNASSNNLLAYYPNYRDAHRSGLGAMFINMLVAFPCLEAVSSYLPVCKVFTYEDDGFRGGRAIIEAGDSGNGFRGVFNGTQKGVFAFGFTGCPEFNLSCFPRWVEYGISCYLPRNICG